jgi:ActR/RegA family two-component response regulator
MTAEQRRTQLLFVDDEESIRLTLPPLLERQGFEVTAVGSVADALVQVNCVNYDVLICDLNLHRQGDGFIVISAMRNLQPSCLNFILTGYPAYDSALQAIQHNVDDYFTKPADLEALVRRIHSKLTERGSREAPVGQRLGMVLRTNTSYVSDHILAAMKQDPSMSLVPLSDDERIGYVPHVLTSLIDYLEMGKNGLPSEVLKFGAEHGKARKKQGYDARMTARDFQLIGEGIYDLMQSNRMPLGVLGLTAELAKFTKGLHSLALQALGSFVGMRRASPPVRT